MIPVLSREALEGMRRADVLTLCTVCFRPHAMKERQLLKHANLQENGTRANLSTTDLIDLSLHASM